MPRQRPPPQLTDGDDEHYARLYEVHPGARISIAKGIDAPDDKRRHHAGEGDLSEHTSSDHPRVAELRRGDEKTVTPWHDCLVSRTQVDALGRDAVAAAIGGLVMVSIVAARMSPPASAIADRYSTLAAILATATVLTVLIVAHERLERPGRLVAVVLLLATGMTWYSSRLWVHEQYFDYLVEQQKTSLDLGCIELAGDIANFLRERTSASPQRPQPATWERDVDALLQYEQETSLLFEAEFGPQVRRTREMLALRGFIDRDLDAFYRRPANAFQITVVARRLAALAHRLERS
jgi:hypothetical protein